MDRVPVDIFSKNWYHSASSLYMSPRLINDWRHSQDYSAIFYIGQVRTECNLASASTGIIGEIYRSNIFSIISATCIDYWLLQTNKPYRTMPKYLKWYIYNYDYVFRQQRSWYKYCTSYYSLDIIISTWQIRALINQCSYVYICKFTWQH